ncbi:CRISPR-associated protein Cas1, partial [mine drainage metagenome]
MRPLLLHGFGTSVRVNGRTLEIDWRSERRKETYRPQQLPFDSVVVDSMTGSVSFEALRFLAIHDVPVTLLRWNGTVLSTILPRGPANGELRVAQVAAYQDPDHRLKIAREFIREKV